MRGRLLSTGCARPILEAPSAHRQGARHELKTQMVPVYLYSNTTSTEVATSCSPLPVTKLLCGAESNCKEFLVQSSGQQTQSSLVLGLLTRPQDRRKHAICTATCT